MLEKLRDKKILILGLGKEGKDSFLFLRKLFPKKVIGVGDREKIKNQKSKIKNSIKGDKRIKWHLGENYLNVLKNYDIIIKSPGVPIHLPEIEKAYKEGKIISPTQIFFENCPGKIIGITGTKGKSTTTALIYKILKQGGIRAHLVGNIGKPVLSLLFSATPKDVYVYELSSHQLYGLKKSPHIAVFLNLFSEHLDYYKNFKEYVNVKINIARYQKKEDFLIYNPKNKFVKEIAGKSRAKKIPISRCLRFYLKQTEIPLLGEFNLLNIAAAIEVGKIFKVPKKIIGKALKNFKPLPHRLNYVGIFKGIKFYDDALSTIPETTIAALDALGKNVKTIILGGYERKIDFTKLAKKILKSRIRNIILFPTTGKRIWEKICQLSQKNLPNHFFVSNMADAVKISYQQTKNGEICLLSTASPSFGLFRDYREKGNLFRKYIKKFG